MTADGELVRASADQHPDLFWALRGGGANFGVVTALEFRMHPVGSELMAGLVLYHADRGREVLQLFRDLMRHGPEELGLAFAYITAPDEPDIPEELRNQPAVLVAGLYAGPVEEGRAALRELREFGPPVADFFEPMPYADFNCSIDDPPGYRNYWTAEHLADLSPAAHRRHREALRGAARGPHAAVHRPVGRRGRAGDGRDVAARGPRRRRSSCTRSSSGRTRPTTSATWRGAVRSGAT